MKQAGDIKKNSQNWGKVSSMIKIQIISSAVGNNCKDQTRKIWLKNQLIIYTAFHVNVLGNI
jgi:uncharacterized membrane protein YcjF (UPF0283 family)